MERQKGEIGARAKARLGRRLVLPVYIAWEMSVLCLPPWAVRGMIGNGLRYTTDMVATGGTGWTILIGG